MIMTSCTAPATRITSPQTRAVRISLRVLMLSRSKPTRLVPPVCRAGSVSSVAVPDLLRRFLILAVVLGVLASACGSDAVTTGDDLAASGENAAWPHAFQAPLIGGGMIDTGDYEGQDLVLWFWAPW